MRNQPLREDIELPQGKVIHVSLDGVKDSKPHKLLINPLVIKTFNGVLEELTRILRPPNAIRAIFTPEHGTRLTLYDQLQDDHIYIAGMAEKFRGQEYHQRLRDLPPIEMEDLPQGRIVYFYLDGDKYARPIRYLINHRTPKEFVEFLDEVGKKLKSPAPLRAVFTPESGTRVTMFQQLLDDHVYIAGSTDKMKG
ncbi:hypothetical protein FSP39_024767 [Pinctada imbricata]|uniref:Doublecortin domain-containing protein n=1 Tax=Pinctada imbricata TaxID=66713 RepID=A0AA88XNR3_PINIB|nr:hypothetical protein FSP39_024767 [Pinctada imbricata]